MSMRFASIEAMEAALGKKLRVRDSFLASNTEASGERAGQSSRRPSRRRPPQSPPHRAAGQTPHDMLWSAVSAVCGGAVREFENAVPGRKYRLDIAIPSVRLAIEVDGWEWHGKHKGDFQRDRERQNLLTLHGWRILRFTAGQIRRDTQGCLKLIEEAVFSTSLSNVVEACAHKKPTQPKAGWVVRRA